MTFDDPSLQKLLRDMYRYAVAHHSMSQAKLTCRVMRGDYFEHDEKFTAAHWALQERIVTLYARPFTQWTHFGPMKVKPLQLSREQRAIHQALIDMRNQEVAHNDPERYTISVTPMKHGVEKPFLLLGIHRPGSLPAPLDDLVILTSAICEKWSFSIDSLRDEAHDLLGLVEQHDLYLDAETGRMKLVPYSLRHAAR